MSRINTNVSSLIARNALQGTNASLQTSLQRLSTGLRINKGADDPAGLIVSERLRSEIAGVSQAIDNVERASNVIATAESSLQEINSLLLSMKSLVLEAANTGAFSKDEVKANQLQIDSAIDSITRIANTTSFAGLKLLNGSLDYITEGVTGSQITDLTVQGVNFGTNTSVPVTVEVLNSAENASLFLSATGGAGAPTNGSALLSSISFEVRGPIGVEVFEFASNTPTSAVAFAINSVRDAVGVSASIVNASSIQITSLGFGTDEFVSVNRLDADKNQSFATVDAPDGNETGRDVGADVLALINGNLAVGDGINLALRTSTLNLEMTLDKQAAQITGQTYSFDINGGGATYQIGPDVTSQQKVGFGIQSVAASNLGNSSTGFLSQMRSGGIYSLVSGTDTADQARFADGILDAAIAEISSLRGRIGAFEKNTLQTTLRSSQVALENLTASESQVRDTDFAEETAKLSRAQVLQQAGTNTLQIANTSAQNVLALLGG
ncbi:flagellin [Poriferisphaera sp. WC338]|uniref:flagellin N-terminal helical domain-containing protein n=1 Tax=Poriferisphaera sp. WC338 TaxID=3425129 RepID=UPI003D819296